MWALRDTDQENTYVYIYTHFEYMMTETDRSKNGGNQRTIGIGYFFRGGGEGRGGVSYKDLVNCIHGYVY